MVCCLPIASMAQQADLSIRDALKLMPDSLVPYLTVNNRLDMIDFMDAKMKAAVDNALTGETEMIYLSDDSLAIKMSEASLLTMKVVKQDTTSVIVLHRTYYTKGKSRCCFDLRRYQFYLNRCSCCRAVKNSRDTCGGR